MNIKSEEAYTLASKIAERTGVTLTQAVINALRAQHRRLTREERIAEIRNFCRETAATMSPQSLAFDIDKELYDEETGLPK